MSRRIVLGEILGVLVNALTVGGKCPVEDCENVQVPIQTQLSEKPKAFSSFFVPNLEFISNFQHFEKKDDCRS